VYGDVVWVHGLAHGIRLSLGFMKESTAH
jgi:hypothetical protein